MNLLGLVVRSLWHFRRLHMALALGVAVGTAVLTGALLVGHSVRASLRNLALERLGPVDEVLLAPRFFRAELATELAAQTGFSEHFDQALPAIYLRASLLNPRPGGTAGGPQGTKAETATQANTSTAAGGEQRPRLTGRVNVLACDEGFWKLFAPMDGSFQPPGQDEIMLNQALADELSAVKGQEIVLRLPKANPVPAETTLGRKTENWETRRLKVKGILPNSGAGRFGIHPNQQLPLNAYTSLSTLQAMLDQEGKANALLVTGRQGPQRDPPPQAEGVLQALLQPKIADYGLSITKTARGYLHLTSDGLLLEDAVVAAAERAFADAAPQAAFTYLANYISAGDGDAAKVPYSTVTALDFTRQPVLGPWRDVSGQLLSPLGENEIVLNQWTFDDMNRQLAASGQTLRVGDPVRLTYFLPDQSGGGADEATATFTLAAVLPLSDDSPARDNDLTPTVEGVTDRRSIANWDPPFPYFPERVRDEDENYWKDYKATPKAFVSLARGRALWGSRRFGGTTSIRLAPAEGRTAPLLESRLAKELSPEALGFRFLAAKRLGLRAASGTTPFAVLFLSFSGFLIAAAVLLVGLLFRLMMEGRASQIGLLLACGFSRRRVRRVLTAEGLCVAALGGLIGIPAGCGYAWLMLYGLRTWWVDAVATPFLTLHVGYVSLVIGGVSGVLTALGAIGFTVWSVRNVSPRRLLAGQFTEASSLVPQRSLVMRGAALVSFLGALALGAFAFTQAGQAQAGTFFGSGVLMLVAGMAWLWSSFRRGGGRVGPQTRWPLFQLAARNGARSPGRSLLTVGLMAAATFLIVALSAFRMDPSRDMRMQELAARLAELERDPVDGAISPADVAARREALLSELATLQQQANAGGTGGFTFVAESALPILRDINDRSVLADEGLQDAAVASLGSTAIYSLRLVPGEDASCRNLYQSRRPRVLGLPRSLRNRGGFAWAGTAAATDAQRANPWSLLEADAGQTPDGRPYVPVVIDMNTAMYSLHLYTVGSTLEIEDDYGKRIPLKLVGMLNNSILQGDLLLSEEHVLQYFPKTTGYRFFLVETPLTATAAQLDEIEQMLESGLANYGLDMERSALRLRDFLVVQNTYLSTFQSLGALGLLLGMVGLAVVQLRNVLERRAELALMRAAGFRRLRLAQLVLAENTWLLATGLGLGVAAALVAVLPQVVQRSQDVPWLYLGGALAAILGAGFLAGLAAVRATLRAPLVAALRGE